MGSTQFNLPDVFDTVAGVHPERNCLVWGDTRLTFAQMPDRSSRPAALASLRPCSVRSTSTQPVNRFSKFQVLCP